MSAGFTQSDTGAPVGLSAGDVLGGKYRVDRIIGEGGMGFVVAATHLHLEEQVAIKLLLPEAVRSPDVVKRFEGFEYRTQYAAALWLRVRIRCLGGGIDDACRHAA